MAAIFLILCIGVSCCLAAEPKFDDHWESFKAIHNKEYESDGHENKSREHFENNLINAAVHNIKYDMGLVPYKKGVHEFSDRPHDEVVEELCGTKPPVNITRRESKIASRGSIPSSVDWRDRGGVTAVKKQLRCGSCWAFALTGSIEGQLAAKGRPVQSLSEQQLVDCDTKDNNGCNGGWPDSSFEYLKKYGIEAAKDYPYRARRGTCRYNKDKVVTKVSEYTDVTSGDEQEMAKAVANHGPLAAAVYVSDQMMDYRGGVYVENDCTKEVNHAVLVVGYGTSDGHDYWIVKNSWGPEWGEKGYIRIARNKGNMCGIASYPSFPTLPD